MRELDERARRLLDIARTGHDPAPGDAARVRAALQARVLAQPALLQAPPPQPSLLGKLALAFGAGGGAGFAVGLYVAGALTAPAAVEAPAHVPPAASVEPADHGRSVQAPALTAPRENSPPAPVLDPALSRGADAAQAATSPAVANGAARRRLDEATTVSARPPKAPAPSGPNPIKAELDGLRRAQELLHQGQPAWAIARLNELDQAKVGTVLLEERMATRAIAECKLGNEPAARISAFQQRFPRSAHLDQVRASCSTASRSGTSPSMLPATQTENAASPHE